MKKLIFPLVSAVFILLSWNGNAQSNIKIGEKAPEFLITEWLLNEPTDTVLENKFIVLDFWATWCKPCLAAVPHINDLNRKFSSQNIIFLSMTDETKETAQKVFDRVDFQTPVVTDEFGQTQINFGDGRKGLVYYPMTVLIDDQNIIRWFGNSDNLTEELMRDFLNKQPINVDQLSAKSPYSKKQDMELSAVDELDLKKWSEMFHDPNVIQFLNIEEVQKKDKKKEPGVFFGNGAYNNFISLEDLFRKLFPRKRIVISESFSNKKYKVFYLNKDLNSDSKQQLLFDIMDQLDLEAKINEEAGVTFLVKIKKKSLLKKSTSQKFDGFKKDEEGNLVFGKQSISGLLNKLSSRSNYYWTYKGKNKNKYAFKIIMTSIESMNKSLESYGLKVKEVPIFIDTIYISMKK